MGSYTKKLAKRTGKNSLEWTPFEEGEAANPFGEGRCVFNSIYQVSIQEQDTDGWVWLSIVRRDREAVHDWRDLQRIKNEVCGPEREAVEIYPAESRLVDTNNQYHLWVLPPGVQFPAGYTAREVGDRIVGAHKQRPFAVAPPDLNGTTPEDGRAGVMFPSHQETEGQGEA